MEKYINIKTPDNHIIYGTLNSKTKSDRLIIFVHGLGCHQNEHIFFNGVKFFNKNGFNVFRWNLYDSSMEKARELRTVNMNNHALDLETVVKYFSKIYKKIIVIGHSLGGLTILKTNPKNITTAVLWDGSLNPNQVDKRFSLNKELNCYLSKGNTETLISKELMEDRFADKTKLLKTYKIPTKIICAGKGILKNQWKASFPLLKNKYEYTEIPKTSHCFDEEGAEEKLFKETLKRLKNF